MKGLMSAQFAVLLVLLASDPSCASTLAGGAKQQMSPVTRVVELLKALYEDVKKDHKADEELYKKFVCWGKSVIDQKETSNADARARIQYLTTYMSDLDSGRIELTTERVDLEKEISELTSDIEVATGIREKEKADYAMAKDEMEKAINALREALEVLRAATKGHESGVLLTLKSRLGEVAASSSAQAASLSYAVHLGDKFLSPGDAVFLQRLLTGDVPTWDWKKLNRKATFKMSYKARSFKIQEVLGKLEVTFVTNLDEATKKEKEAQELFDKLMTSKEGELDAAQMALTKMEKENEAKALSMSEASAEAEALEKQVSDDEGYIKMVQEALDFKKEEWKARLKLRSEEMAAIAKAIEILHSDDARDLFKKSLTSQGYLFLQQGQGLVSRLSHRRNTAVSALQNVAHATHDQRLAALATLAKEGRFDDVIKAIDMMVGILKGEEAEDLKRKEECEEDRATNTRDAIVASRTMDEMTELIVRLQGEIKELAAEIEQKHEQIKAIVVELADAKKLRDDEHAVYLVDKKDDEDAKALVLEAKAVLENFYNEKNLKLGLTQRRKQPVVVEAGKAPPPPPTTWDAPYAGKVEEQTGIIAILAMIAEDIQHDIDKCDKEEAAALALYEKTTNKLTHDKSVAEQLILKLEGKKGEKEQQVETTTGDRIHKKGELAAILETIKKVEPGCNYFTINFLVRTRDRQIELDGLLKAKAILSGAKFDGLPDPDRELKPFDA